MIFRDYKNPDMPFTIDSEDELENLPTGVGEDGKGEEVKTGIMCKLVDGTDFRIFAFFATKIGKINDYDPSDKVIEGYWYEI